jgi:hypothetical protein
MSAGLVESDGQRPDAGSQTKLMSDSLVVTRQQAKHLPSPVGDLSPRHSNKLFHGRQAYSI